MATFAQNKHILEKQKGVQEPITIEVKEFKQSVFISKCESLVVVVKGKCNNIQIEGCKQVNVLFDDVVGSVELVNCVKVNLQANGKLPTLNIERTSGVNAYLQTAESKQVEVVTSSATEINLVLPGATADSDPKELPIPSQFVTKIENDKPVTKPVEHSAN